MSELVTPPHPTFSPGEMTRRYAALRDGMAALGVDACLMSGEENVTYLVGTSPAMAPHASHTRPSMLIVPLAAPPVLLTMGGGNARACGFVRDVRGYNELLSFPIDALVDACRLLGLHAARVGFELGHEQRMGLPIGAFLDLRARLPGMTAVDAGPLLHRVRMRKSAEELALMRRAADVTAAARQRLFRDPRLRVGLTERGVDRLMRQLILEEGGDDTSFVILQSERPGAANALKPDRPLERGDVLAIDAGARVGPYTIDYPRMCVLGRATAAQRRAYEAVLRVNAAMGAALRPGVRCSELFAVAMDATERVGATIDDPSRLRSGRLGHGQGMLITEPPSIMAADDTTLEPGMVISTEPGVRVGGVSMLYEDVHVITDEGAERLTNESDELCERSDF